MRAIQKKALILLPLSVLLSSCANIEKPQVVQIDQGPAISKTIVDAKGPGLKTGLKRKVAIGRFTNESKYGQSFLIDKSNDRIGKQAVDILSTKLMQTDKFILLERYDLDKINKELGLGNSSSLKNMADYLIVGSVTEFGRKEQGKVGIFSRTKKQVAYAKVHVRLVDVYTGEITYSEEGQGEAFSEAGTVVGIGARAGYDSTLNDKALEAAITNLASNIIENLLDKPWRAYILGEDNGSLIISGGEAQNIKVGDMFEVLVQGKKIKNPQTNMDITLPGKRIASIKVIATLGDSPENQVSMASVVSGDLADFIRKSDYSQLYIEEPK